MKALIFGINGQDGHYLSLLLRSKGLSVVGVSRTNSSHVLGDVSDRDFVARLIKEQQPDFVFHLAAKSTTGYDSIFENHKTIVTGGLNVLDAVYKYSSSSKVFLSGSALQFKNIGQPISEETEFEARDPYSMSRIHSAYLARYFRRMGLKVYMGYFFHHDSPLRGENHLSMRIVKHALRVKNGEHFRIAIGDTKVVKEFNFAGDFMDAVWMFVNQDDIHEVVVGSGVGYPIERWLDICFSMIGKDWRDYVVQGGHQPEFQSLTSDPKLLLAMGWRQKTEIDALARLMMMS